MSDYSKSYDGAGKDAAVATIFGADFDTEFTAIQTAIATKANKVTPTAAGNIATLSSSGDLQDSGKNLSHRGALVFLTSNQSIPNTTITALNFGSENYDTDSIHSTITNTNRLTVPSGVSKVRLQGHVEFASNATGTRAAYLFLNNTPHTSYAGGSATIIPTSSGSDIPVEIHSPVMGVTPGDYFELRVSQTSGGALNAQANSTWFAMEIIE